MPNTPEQTAWRFFCRKLETIGIDPYDPILPADDPRYEKVVAIVTEYAAATTHKLALPPDWEGHPPIQPVATLPNLAEWLAFQWQLVKGWELAGDKAKSSALKDASRAIRNAFRVLDWLDVEDRPERPFPADDLGVVKKQIDELERWVRDKHKTGFKPTPKQAKAAPRLGVKKHPKRDDIPDDAQLNVLVKKYLDDHPKATVRDVAKAVGISTGKVSELEAWRREMAVRKAAKPTPKSRERPLTAEMLAVIGKNNDPAAKENSPVKRPIEIGRTAGTNRDQKQ